MGSSPTRLTKMSKAAKERTLGMPLGTANNRLKKSIIFNLLQKLNALSCFRCSKEILTADDMTTDHKIEWEGVSSELFFDVNNIAFSHVKCNRPKTKGSIKLRKIGPTGTSWCTSCKQFLDNINFNKDSSHWNGLNATCKSCFQEYRRDR